MNDGSSHLTENQLAAFIDGNREVQQQVNEHLRHCLQCSRAMAVSMQGHLQLRLELEEKRAGLDMSSQLAVVKHALQQGSKSEANLMANKPVDSSGKSQWGLLGGLGALGGMFAGANFGSSAPALGGAELGAPEHTYLPDHVDETLLHESSQFGGGDDSPEDHLRSDLTTIEFAHEEADGEQCFTSHIDPTSKDNIDQGLDNFVTDTFESNFSGYDVMGPPDQLSLPDEGSQPPEAANDWHPPPADQ